jgi:hypothetical protein
MAIMRLPRLRVRTYMLLVGVVAQLFWAVMIGFRSYVHFQLAWTYSTQANDWREMAQRELSQGNTRTVEAAWGLQSADYYAALARKHRRALWRPWISVDPDPPLFFPGGPPPVEGFDLQVISWGDDSGAPTVVNPLVIVGTASNGLLHIRMYGAAGILMVDTNETMLPARKATVVATLKRHLPGLLPPHVLTKAEKSRVLGEVLSLVGQTLAEILQKPPDEP